MFITMGLFKVIGAIILLCVGGRILWKIFFPDPLNYDGVDPKTGRAKLRVPRRKWWQDAP